MARLSEKNGSLNVEELKWYDPKRFHLNKWYPNNLSNFFVNFAFVSDFIPIIFIKVGKMCLCCSNRTVLASVLCWSTQLSHLKSAVLKKLAQHYVLIFKVLGNQYQHIVLSWGTKHSTFKVRVLSTLALHFSGASTGYPSTALCAVL